MVGTEFGLGAGAFGLMNSIMAIGSVAGALLSAGRGKPRLRVIFGAAGAFGVTCGHRGAGPSYFWFGIALVPVGLFAITMMTSANGYVQTTTDPVMRGRVMALYMAIFMGGTPIGAPLVGWVANVAGPRWSMAVAAGAGLLAALIGLVWIIRAKQLRLHFNRRARGLRYFRARSRRTPPPQARGWTGSRADAPETTTAPSGHLAGTTPSDAEATSQFGHDEIDALEQCRDIVRLDRHEGGDAQLVAAQLAVRLGVDDAVGAEHLGDGCGVDRVVEVDRGDHVRAVLGLGHERRGVSRTPRPSGKSGRQNPRSGRRRSPGRRWR